MLKVRLQIGQQVNRCSFRNRSNFYVTVRACQLIKRFRHKFLAQMERALVLGAPDGILVQPFFGQSNFSTASLNASMRPATEGSPVNFPSMLLCKNGAELQRLTSDGVR